MTKNRAMLQWRKIMLGAVITAGICLAAGTSALGNQAVQKATTETEVPANVETVEMDIGDDDRYLLCKIAMAEAGNQDTEGKALVMRVVINRAQGDNGFPGTVREVIYQPGQFSPILEGKFDGVEPDGDCWEALEMVEGGWDESQDALYFESRSGSTWHRTHLEFLFQHGGHYFYTERD